MPPNDPSSRINEVVPRLWDPANIDAGFKYDPKNYDPAQYRAFADARAERDAERSAQAQRDLAAALDDVTAAIREQLSAEVEKIDGNLVWFGASKCFSDLEWDEEAGGVSATFAKDGSNYFYPMDREEAADFFAAASAGKFFNAEIR